MKLRDEDIQRNVIEQLKWDARLKSSEIGVTVKEGVVSLVGTVDSYTKKVNAEDVALRVAGVRTVVNDLKVKLPTSSERTDEDIARAAQMALELSYAAPDTVKVVVEDGWITLRGEVEWYFQKEEAERKVRDLAGVKGVINLIEIKPKAQPEEVKQRIESALVRTVQEDAKNIQVNVSDGRVKLEGKVHSWFEKEEARRQAWLAPGVREVVDNLVVGA